MDTPANGTSVNILLVEDSTDDAFLIERELRKGGFLPQLYRVDRLAALEQALDREWDVVITDYNLPGFCALDVLTTLDRRGLDLPCIVVSGAIGEETAVEAMHAGANDYIMKDSLTRLNSALDRELQEAEGRRQRQLAEHALRESEEHFRQLAGNIDGVLWLIDLTERRMVYVNPGYEQVWERPAARLFESLENFLETVHPEDYDRIEALLASPDGWVNFNDEYRIQRQDGSERWVNTRSFAIRDESGKVYRCAALTSDITERKRLEAEREKLFRALEQTADMVMITNRDAVIEYVNSAFEDVTGYSRDDVIGQKPSLLSSGLQDDQFFQRLWRTLSSGLPFTDLFINRRHDGDLYYEAKTITPVRNEHGEVTHFVATSKDVTQRLARQEAMQHVVSYDALTGLGNRLLFVDHLNKSRLKAGRVGQSLGVLCIGLDLEGLLGETQMEQLGERLLVAAGRRIKGILDRADGLARLSQQEFAAIVSDIGGRTELELIAQQLMDAFARPLEAEGYELYLNLSIGISIFPDDSHDTDDLIKQAETAMRHTRTHERAGYGFFNRETMAISARRKGLSG